MVKILTVGSAHGQIRALFDKIKSINSKHGPFDFCLCIGDFFSLEYGEETAPFLAGEIEAPIECYIMQGSTPLPDTVVAKYSSTSGQLCKKVFMMTKSGTLTTANGLRIACLSGLYDPDVYSTSETAPGFLSPYFSSQTVDRLLSNSLSTSSSSTGNYGSLASIQASASTTQTVDILISHSWPSSIANFANVPPLSEDEFRGVIADPIDEVTRKLKPKYHFVSAGGKFWEREPYVWTDEGGRVSRFVTLGSFGGDPPPGQKKQRWFYAYSMIPDDQTSPTRPVNATNNPFTQSSRPPKRALEDAENFIFGAVQQQAGNKRSRIGGEPGKPPPGYKCKRCESSEHFIQDCPERVKPPEGYICKICNVPGHLVRDCPTRHAVGDTGGKKPKPGYVCRACASEDHYLDDCPVANSRGGGGSGGGRGRRGPVKEITTDDCWFCLSNPNLAKHLIVAIGNECYVTLTKGQIVPSQSQGQSAVPGGGHVLIIPITHYPTYSTIPPDLSPPIVQETEAYKTALRALHAKHGCASVFFEIGRLAAKGGHAHVQCVPVSLNVKDSVRDAYVNGGKALGIDFVEGEAEVDEALGSVQGGRGGYFKVDLPDGSRLVHVMKDGVPFSVNFGRQVLVGLMDAPERLDWKECMLTDEEDKADAEAFKKAFAPFNTVS
ncbi:nuclear protein [Flagelloscypha sp. PMI_526]|nr:nuclear protein [Flagelloscypha sp. PMI_526]